MSVRRSTGYNIVGAVLPLLVTLFTLPIYLRTIGEERYGVLIILWTILGYFGLFDLGLGRAVTNRLAALRAATARAREQVFWTALLVNFGLGALGAVVLWGLGSLLFNRLVELPSGLAPEVLASWPWIVTAFPLLLTSSVLSGALMGREEFLSQNAAAVGVGSLVQAVPLLVALKVEPTLPALVISVIGTRAVGTMFTFALCVRRLPVSLWPVFARTEIRPLLSFGGWVTVTSAVSPLLDVLDRIVIGALSGARAVAYYTVPFSLASRISILPGSLSSALFPRFSALVLEERDALFDLSVRSLVVLVTPLAVAGMLAMEPFLTIWVGGEFASRSAPVGEILVIGIWANCLAYMPFAKLQAEGRPDRVAKYHLAELLPYVLTLWAGLTWWGVAGAAVAWSLRSWVDAILLFRASHLRSHKSLYVGVIVMAIAVVVTLFTSGTQLEGLVARVLLTLCSLAWAWHAAPADVKRIVSRVPRFFYHAEVMGA